jgi:hypothetical protein
MGKPVLGITCPLAIFGIAKIDQRTRITKIRNTVRASPLPTLPPFSLLWREVKMT